VLRKIHVEFLLFISFKDTVYCSVRYWVAYLCSAEAEFPTPWGRPAAHLDCSSAHVRRGAGVALARLRLAGGVGRPLHGGGPAVCEERGGVHPWLAVHDCVDGVATLPAQRSHAVATPPPANLKW
jgi:hypothetical protein